MLNKERLIKEFEELVALPCESKKEKKVAELVKAKLQQLGVEYYQDNVNLKTGGECGNVIAFLPSNVQHLAKPIFFEAHLDSVSPCTGTKVIRKNGILYSDGTTVLGGDDKVGVASMLEAITAIKEDNLQHGDVQFLFTVSEEIGCFGAKYCDTKKIKAEFGYCLDTEGQLGDIVYAAPKQYEIWVKVLGKTAHGGAEPEKGINAVMLASKALSALPKYGRIDAETTMNIGVIKGGTAHNIVPAECEFVIDMRSLNDTKLERLKDETIEIIKKSVSASGGKTEIQVDNSCPGAVVAENHPCVALASAAAKNLGAKEIHLQKSGGCSDGNFYCGMGFPTVVLGTGMSNIHTTEEYLKEEDLFNAARWVYEIVRLAGEGK